LALLVNSDGQISNQISMLNLKSCIQMDRLQISNGFGPDLKSKSFTNLHYLERLILI